MPKSGNYARPKTRAQKDAKEVGNAYAKINQKRREKGAKQDKKDAAAIRAKVRQEKLAAAGDKVVKSSDANRAARARGQKNSAAMAKRKK